MLDFDRETKHLPDFWNTNKQHHT